MKKFIFIIAILFAGMATFAQSDYSYSLTTNNDASGTFWNNADTLEDGQTLDALIRLRSPNPLNLRFQIIADEITGTGTYTATLLGSNDGVTYIDTGDSITAALTADGSIWVLAESFNYSYAKLLMTSSGTETSRFKTYYSIRKE